MINGEVIMKQQQDGSYQLRINNLVYSCENLAAVVQHIREEEQKEGTGDGEK